LLLRWSGNMSKGILFFATNNDNVNYLKIAYTNALMCKRNLGKDLPISVVTSTISIDQCPDIRDQLETIFDQIIIDDKTDGQNNVRRYSNTQYFSLQDRFINTNRNSAYELSPYDETLLLDVDFLIQDSSLNSIWGSVEDFMINDMALNLDHLPLLGEEFRLNPTGIKMVWATAVYFRKTDRVKTIFDMVAFIREHWDYYKLLYGFGGYLFRNDFAFSIALHIMNGFLENDEFKKLPTPFILTSTDRDHIHEVGDGFVKIMYNDMKFQNQNHEHAFYLTKIKGHNVHIMNKLSLLKFLDDLIEIYKDE
jgi:hypothetical protein